MAGPRSPFPIHYLDEAIGFLVPRSFVPVVRPLVPSFRSLVPPFRSFVPSFLIHRFITPSPPSGKEASLTLGIIYTIILNTLVRGMPVLKTRNSLNLISTERGGTKTPLKLLPCAGDRPWSAWYGRPSCPTCLSYVRNPKSFYK